MHLNVVDTVLRLERNDLITEHMHVVSKGLVNKIAWGGLNFSCLKLVQGIHMMQSTIYCQKKRQTVFVGQNHRELGNAVNANEEMLAGYADPDASNPDADPDAT